MGGEVRTRVLGRGVLERWGRGFGGIGLWHWAGLGSHLLPELRSGIPCEFRTGGMVLDHALLPESIAAVAGAFR
ncbi:hypothetical protein GCM10009743_66950 [Kribbella swartbergensis]